MSSQASPNAADPGVRTVAGRAGDVVLGELDIANLTTDLAGKAPTLVPTAVKAANYTASPGDFVPVDTTSGAVAITLPTAPADGSRVAAKLVIQGGTNAVTIACGGSDAFNKAGGPTSATLTLLNQTIGLQYHSGIWYVVGDDLPLSQLDLRYATRSAFGASGASHAAGLVPDPGATAGTSKFIREDSTFAVPAATVASGTSGRIPFETTGGVLADSSNLTWNNGIALLGAYSINVVTTINVDTMRFNAFTDLNNLSSKLYSKFDASHCFVATTYTPTMIPLSAQGAASQTAPLFGFQQLSSTATVRDMGYLDGGFVGGTKTDASYLGEIRLVAQDFGNNSGANPAGRQFARGWSDGNNGRFALSAPASAPDDTRINNNQISFYLDEAGGNLKVRVRKSDGTYKTGTLAIA